MADWTAIEWCVEGARPTAAIPATWNPVMGCSRATDGCKHCYAARIAYRFGARGNGPYAGLAELDGEGIPRFNGTLRVRPHEIRKALGWKKRRFVFLGSLTDLGHPALAPDDLRAVLSVVARRPLHTFVMFTKRPDVLRDRLADPALSAPLAALAGAWPMPNYWVAASTCAPSDEWMIPALLAVPAARLGLSCEPLLGPLSIRSGFPETGRRLDFILTGAESGPNRRPMSEAWVRTLREEAKAAGAPFFYKQAVVDGRLVTLPTLDGRQWTELWV